MAIPAAAKSGTAKRATQVIVLSDSDDNDEEEALTKGSTTTDRRALPHSAHPLVADSFPSATPLSASPSGSPSSSLLRHPRSDIHRRKATAADVAGLTSAAQRTAFDAITPGHHPDRSITFKPFSLESGRIPGFGNCGPLSLARSRMRYGPDSASRFEDEDDAAFALREGTAKYLRKEGVNELHVVEHLRTDEGVEEGADVGLEKLAALWLEEFRPIGRGQLTASLGPLGDEPLLVLQPHPTDADLVVREVLFRPPTWPSRLTLLPNETNPPEPFTLLYDPIAQHYTLYASDVGSDWPSRVLPSTFTLPYRERDYDHPFSLVDCHPLAAPAAAHTPAGPVEDQEDDQSSGEGREEGEDDETASSAGEGSEGTEEEVGWGERDEEMAMNEESEEDTEEEEEEYAMPPSAQAPRPFPPSLPAPPSRHSSPEPWLALPPHLRSSSPPLPLPSSTASRPPAATKADVLLLSSSSSPTSTSRFAPHKEASTSSARPPKRLGNAGIEPDEAVARKRRRSRARTTTAETGEEGDEVEMSKTLRSGEKEEMEMPSLIELEKALRESGGAVTPLMAKWKMVASLAPGTLFSPVFQRAKQDVLRQKIDGKGGKENSKVNRRKKQEDKLYGDVAEVLYFILTNSDKLEKVLRRLQDDGDNLEHLALHARTTCQIITAPACLSSTKTELLWFFTALRSSSRLTLLAAALRNGGVPLLDKLTGEDSTEDQITSTVAALPLGRPSDPRSGVYFFWARPCPRDGPVAVAEEKKRGKGKEKEKELRRAYGGSGERREKGKRKGLEVEGGWEDEDGVEETEGGKGEKEEEVARTGVGARVGEHLSDAYRRKVYEGKKGKLGLHRSRFYLNTFGGLTPSEAELARAKKANLPVEPAPGANPSALLPSPHLFAITAGLPAVLLPATEALLVSGGGLAQGGGRFDKACEERGLVFPPLRPFLPCNTESAAEDRLQDSFADPAAQAARGRKGGATRGKAVKAAVAAGTKEGKKMVERLRKAAVKGGKKTAEKNLKTAFDRFLSIPIPVPVRIKTVTKDSRTGKNLTNPNHGLQLDIPKLGTGSASTARVHSVAPGAMADGAFWVPRQPGTSPAERKKALSRSVGRARAERDEANQANRPGTTWKGGVFADLSLTVSSASKRPSGLPKGRRPLILRLNRVRGPPIRSTDPPVAAWSFEWRVGRNDSAAALMFPAGLRQALVDLGEQLEGERERREKERAEAEVEAEEGEEEDEEGEQEDETGEE
ncbi:hypothetical protein JCM8097_002872 [Rhodosporidiobolus ruineniae]